MLKDPRPPELHDAPTRTAVLILHAEMYRARHGLSHEHWCEALDAAYCDLVPEQHRAVKAPDLRNITDAKTYLARLRSWDQQVRRWVDGDVRMPVDVEEAWVEALPEPYRTDCKRELARRMGMWGAIKAADGAAGDHECWARNLQEFGAITTAMGRILADGCIGPQDEAHLREMIPHADAMRSHLTSLMERSRSVLDQCPCTPSDDSPNVSPLRRAE